MPWITSSVTYSDLGGGGDAEEGISRGSRSGGSRDPKEKEIALLEEPVPAWRHKGKGSGGYSGLTQAGVQPSKLREQGKEKEHRCAGALQAQPRLKAVGQL